MIKYTSIKLILLCFTLSGFTQVEKGNWLLGADLSLSRNKSSGADAVNGKESSLLLNAAVGHFFVDKLAAGLHLNADFQRNSYEGSLASSSSSHTNISLGPFLRYYLLPVENQVNIITEGAVGYSFFSNHFNIDTRVKTNAWQYSLFAGPVLYLNSSVGVEFLLGYIKNKTVSIDASGDEIRFRVGLRYYLEPIKN